MTRAQLRDHLDAGGLRTEGQAFIHLAFRAALLGVVVRGPIVGRQHAYVLVRDWLGEPPEVDRDTALAELARRYLRGHGPADDRDLAKWAGLPLRDARAGLGAISSEIEEREDGAVRLVDGSRLREDAAAPASRRLRPEPGRLVLTRGDRRRPRSADRHRRDISALRVGRRPRGRGLEMGGGAGRDRPAGGHLRPGVEIARARWRGRRPLPQDLINP